ncbi:MAG: ABC transporter substrate-binding protein [Elusimicrobia bacterium]|nr:ABC transporter substrate-binding protein [Elusimicrobiota bacterium]
MKKIIFLVLAAISVNSYAAAKNPNMLFYAHIGEITTLDPVYPYDAITQGMMLNVYETLLMFKGSSLSEYEPTLASKVPSVTNSLISKDGLTYTFPIKKNIKFHNGNILKPEDVKYSLLRFMLTDPSGGPASLMLEPVFAIASTRDLKGQFILSKKEIENAVKIENDNVIVKLKRPFAPFLSIIARWSYIMNKQWCIENGEWDGTYETLSKYNNRPKEDSFLLKNMNGTGPFKFERWDLNSKQLLFSSFKDYRKSPASIKMLVMKTVPEFGTRRLMLEAGDADIIDVPRTFETQVRGLKGTVIEDNLPRLLTDPVFFFTFKVNPLANPDIGSGRLDGNGIPPNFFSNKDIRKAFALSFDYQGFLKEGMKNKATLAKGSIPPGLLGYNSNTPSYKFNKTKAAEYFKKAYNGKLWTTGFQFTLTFNTGSEVRQLACQVLKRNIESINPKFKIDIRGVDWPIYLEKTQNKKMPLFTRGWTGDYPDAHNFIFPFYHSKGRYAIAQNYSNAEMDKLINLAVSQTSTIKRKELYKEIQKLAHEETIQIYTIHPQGLLAMRDWVKGFYDNAVFMGIYFYPISK